MADRPAAESTGAERRALRVSGAARVTLADAVRRQIDSGKLFVPLLQHGSLLLEYYAPRGSDPQQPHTRDELYIVASGSGWFVAGEERFAFSAGDTLFVAAGVVHRFEQFGDDFGVWVVFYGPEGGEASV